MYITEHNTNIFQFLNKYFNKKLIKTAKAIRAILKTILRNLKIFTDFL